MDVFFHAATSIKNRPIETWKNAGKKVVGYTCSYVPAEIFDAADILPVRLRGIETEGMEIGDSYYGPFICSFPKCLLQLAGKGMFDFLDGAIITPGCDAMRRLDECWRKAGEDYAGIVPSFFYYFDVPHKTMPHNMSWFITEIRNLIQKIETHFTVEITEAKLKAAIRKYNKGRSLLQAMEDLRTMDGGKITGTEAFAAVVAGTVMPRNEFNDAMETWLEALSHKKNVPDNKRRLMLLGSISDDIDLVELMEKETDAVVVAENLCFGIRHAGNQIPEDGDPVEALARHYLGGSICPRMFGAYAQRIDLIREKVKQARVEGVVMQNIRFCDLHGAENALFERDLEAEGIPCLRIEREYGPLTETGRMKLRINAFLERIGG
jgi:benzoyl-CoA reductase subunit C